jgi:hypothetical protein
MTPDRPDIKDRDLSCQEAMNDRLFALMDQATDAGWTEKEVAQAAQDLTVAWRRWRREKRATDEQVAAAARINRQ